MGKVRRWASSTQSEQKMSTPTPKRVIKVQELRRSNAAGPIPSKKVYDRKKVKKVKIERPK
jgi:hypothetical protein